MSQLEESDRLRIISQILNQRSVDVVPNKTSPPRAVWIGRSDALKIEIGFDPTKEADDFDIVVARGAEAHGLSLFDLLRIAGVTLD